MMAQMTVDYYSCVRVNFICDMLVVLNYVSGLDYAMFVDQLSMF
jgi:hypothetical protein